MPFFEEDIHVRLKKAEAEIAREFAHLDPRLVLEHFEGVARDLLREATVTDFVPVLARRYARERLQTIVSDRRQPSQIAA